MQTYLVRISGHDGAACTVDIRAGSKAEALQSAIGTGDELGLRRPVRATLMVPADRPDHAATL